LREFGDFTVRVRVKSRLEMGRIAIFILTELLVSSSAMQSRRTVSVFIRNKRVTSASSFLHDANTLFIGRQFFGGPTAPRRGFVSANCRVAGFSDFIGPPSLPVLG